MKRWMIALALYAAGCGLLMADPVPAQTEAGKGLEGIWQGTLDVSGQKVTLIFKIVKSPEGRWTGTMDVPAQNAAGIPLSDIQETKDSVRLEIKALNFLFTGKPSKDSGEIAGTLRQGSVSLPLTLKKGGKAPEIRRPQTPQKPYPYEEEQVTYENRAAGVTLSGTLTLPRAAGKAVPAVLLVAGSGPNTRDEAVAGHQIFLVLADYLTRQGIAVLRVDKRGIGKSTGNYATATTEDFASDALAGVDYLKHRKEITSSKIGLIGHSEGGLIAPLVASRSNDVAFIVLMAGPGLIGEQILYKQGELIARAAGAPDAAIAQNRSLQEQLFAAVKQEKDPEAMRKRLDEIVKKLLAGVPEAQKKQAETAMDAQIKMVSSPWMRHFLTYDPIPALSKVRCPVLALNGAKDLQVPPKEDLEAIGKALKTGGNTHYLTQELPGLNHLFQTCKTGSPQEYGQIEETMSPVALKRIVDWIPK
jgi:fermentation-respiration switch protein FrsA (DUF1100 family)